MLSTLCATALMVSVLLSGTSAAAYEQPALTENHLLELIEQHENRAVLINFFASWCPPCRQEIPVLKELRTRYSQKDILIIGISVDTDTHVLEAFEKSSQCNYPIYIASPELTSTLQIDAIPRTVILDRQQRPVLNVTGIVPREVLQETLDSLLKISQ